MPTIIDLGRQVKAKYPTQYDDLPDIEVGRRVKAKYPQYADFEDVNQEERTVGGFLSNIPSSGLRMGTDIVNAVSSPWQTTKAIAGMAAGGVEKLIPGEQGQEGNWDALMQFYKDRYGSWDNFTKTLYEDPVGVAADVSSIAGLGGGLAKGTATVAKVAKAGGIAKTAGKVGEIAGAVAEVSDPLRMVTRGVKAGLGATGLPERLYESALKPSLGKKNLPKIAGEIQTAMAEGVPVSAGGLDKVGDLIMDLQDEVKAHVIQNRKKTISPTAVAKRADQPKQMFGVQVNPQADLEALAASKAEFLNKYAVKDVQGNIVGYRKIPVEDAQASKVATYRSLKDKSYGELKGASIEAQKALARGLKEELAAAIPELTELNLREGKLLDLEPVLEKAVARIRNHQLFGIGTPIAAGGVHAMTGSNKLALAAGVMRAIIEQPQVKSRIAIAISRARKLNPDRYRGVSVPTAASRVQEYMDSLGSSGNQSQVYDWAPDGGLTPVAAEQPK